MINIYGFEVEKTIFFVELNLIFQLVYRKEGLEQSSTRIKKM